MSGGERCAVRRWCRRRAAGSGAVEYAKLAVPGWVVRCVQPEDRSQPVLLHLTGPVMPQPMEVAGDVDSLNVPVAPKGLCQPPLCQRSGPQGADRHRTLSQSRLRPSWMRAIPPPGSILALTNSGGLAGRRQIGGTCPRLIPRILYSDAHRPRDAG
ncbi:hypothethical protein (plasmid) [Ralstonia solanacearum PSI07]|nr:hypothethical protein [Ralstonia solanacearum PSI07]